MDEWKRWKGFIKNAIPTVRYFFICFSHRLRCTIPAPVHPRPLLGLTGDCVGVVSVSVTNASSSESSAVVIARGLDVKPFVVVGRIDDSLCVRCRLLAGDEGSLCFVMDGFDEM